MRVSQYNFDGRQLAEHLLAATTREWRALSSPPASPHLAIVQVGDHDASNVYIRRKIRACEKVGFRASRHVFATDVSQATLLDHVQSLNDDPDVTGILIQLPLPPSLNTSELIKQIDSGKDVDGMTPTRLGALVTGSFHLLPCTTAAILALLSFNQIELCGKSICMIGASALVGKPTALALIHHHATVTICHSETRDLAACIREADIVIVAIGNPNVIQAEWIQPETIVIDVGINRCADGKIIGDVPARAIVDKGAFATPVPGGVGPLTVASLVRNLWLLYREQQDLD
jgi:methylenetetrahydrofolate dehydrogenase (NADP+)/methenyltetrahydrofolate cyclohydrolase